MVARDAVWIDDTADIKAGDGLLERDPVDLGQKLCLADALLVKGQEDVLLVNAGKVSDRIDYAYPFLVEYLLIRAVAVYDHSMREHLRK